jgi:hypothetical protein
MIGRARLPRGPVVCVGASAQKAQKHSAFDAIPADTRIERCAKRALEASALWLGWMDR